MQIEQIDLVGYAAALLVFMSFCMKTLEWLRIMAVISNIAFIGYGVGAELLPILILHGVLLPMNIFRLHEHLALKRRIRKATREIPDVNLFPPFMRVLDLKDGETVFRKGDAADRLFYVQKGTILIEEIEKIIEAGELFGEIELFSGGQSRTTTAKALGEVEICEITWKNVMQIYQLSAANDWTPPLATSAAPRTKV